MLIVAYTISTFKRFPCFTLSDIHTKYLTSSLRLYRQCTCNLARKKVKIRIKNKKYGSKFLKLATFFFWGNIFKTHITVDLFALFLFFFHPLMMADSLGDHKPLWVESAWRTFTTVYLMDTERDRNDCEPQGVSGYLCVVPISLGV